MPNATSPQHVYSRSVSGEAQDSLSIIAGHINPGQSLLDLGMGTGGLGQHLSEHFALVADGVTLNPAEAEIASRWYRQSKVADLDSVKLAELLEGQRYDCIVCADVLEHLKSPQNLLLQCQELLQPGGRLIASVPNAGYCGLIAELMQGEFRYRTEGLLDKTHLRFFTRQSLLRFLDELGWTAIAVETTRRELNASEFNVAFDSLPPSVARYLLALPDALTYQFILTLQPKSMVINLAQADTAPVTAEPQLNVSALFSMQLYLATKAGYQEDNKLVTAGSIGCDRQLLSFEIAPSALPYTAIRLDPADRPGFFKLHSINCTLADGTFAWQWNAQCNDIELLRQTAHQQLLFQQPWVLSDDALLFLYGDDAWLELPLPQVALEEVARQGARLQVCAGWPMSADYAQASLTVSALQQTQQATMSALNSKIRDCDQLSVANEALTSRLVAAEDTFRILQSDKQTILHELRETKLDNHTRRNQLEELQRHLQAIEASTVFRVTRPLVGLKMKLDQLFGASPVRPNHPTTVQNTKSEPLPLCPVDIIVPVYRGLADTRCCIESVLNSSCQSGWRLIVINDQCPEPELTNWLRDIASTDNRITLLENSQNLGFVGTVNRGMALSTDNDVLLLNSDAEVANDWLDRLQRAAYSAPNVASVTPFSNNATICSYPRFCQANEMPEGWDTATLDLLLAKYLTGQSVTVPTGVGFCLYVRRACLQQIGLFDVANFGKGYGEENDFCVRAQAAGWHNLHALDTFVRHAGGISFGESKSERELQAMETLRRLHPRYEAEVQTYVRQDPAQSARMVIDIARIVGSGKPVILSVTHNREGGTLRHIQELAHHLAKQATLLRLSPAPRGVSLKLEGIHEAFELHFALPQEHDALLRTLRLLQVGHIHFQHLLGHSPDIAELPEKLGITHDFTIHDYYSFCPQISLTDHTDRYCGEEGSAQCRSCLQRNPAPYGLDIDTWRNNHTTLLNQARYVMAPSLDAVQRIRKYAPAANVCFVPHANLLPAPPPCPAPMPQPLSEPRPLIVAVLGALSRIKGADVLESVATLAANQNAPVEFHLLGYAYRNLRTQPKAKLTVHGAYEDTDLPQLLAWLKPDVVWFPAVWPETYSYTLSACLESGLPVVAPNIGAFAERLQGRSWSWVCDWQQDSAAWLAFFETIRAKNFCAAASPLVIEAAVAETQAADKSIDYYEDYLATLPVPPPLIPDQLWRLQEAIEQSQPKRSQPAMQLKSSALRAIMRLRATALMSPMAKWVPMHLQRRVKSWLGT